jgi:hypothetical protein
VSTPLQTPPKEKTTAGTAFSYATWPKNTTITLTNVNWNQSYRDVNWWNSRNEFDQWIDGQPNNTTITKSSWKKFGDNVLQIGLPLTQAMQFNYVRVANPALPIVGDVPRPFYYFITSVTAISGSTTQFTLQLDVWQTFIHDVQLGQCYIEQGHLGIANTKAFDNYGRDYLDMPEGLDIGDEYRIVKTANQEIMSSTDYSVLLCSTLDLTQDPGTAAKPKIKTAPGSIVDGIASGASFYLFPTPGDFVQFMKDAQNVPWITEGIINATLIPAVSRYHTEGLTNVGPNIILGQATLPGNGGSIQITTQATMYAYPASASGVKTLKLAPNWRDTFMQLLPVQYRMLKKFLTSPYCIIEITTFTGSPLIAKPEAWADDDATIQELAVMVPPGQRISFAPYRYNADDQTSPNGADDNGEFLDFATSLSSFVSVPLVNNAGISYLASNRNGLAYQFRASDWSQTKALMGAQATEDVANAEIRNIGRQTAAGVTATGAQSQLTQETDSNLGVINGALGVVGAGAQGGVQYGEAQGAHSAGSVGSSFGGGAGVSVNPLSMANYDATATIRANATAQAAAIQNNAAAARGQSSITAMGNVRDTNVSLARRSAKGDYQNSIAGIQAKMRDAAMMQPSVSGQFGGDAMNLAHNQVKVSVRFKLVDKATIRRVGNYWLRYGYAVGTFGTLPANFQCMTKFTYWKLSETYLVNSRIPEMFKDAIRGIFEKGVTVWNNPGDIGTTSLHDNEPLPGIFY